jgi:hypothetical protein
MKNDIKNSFAKGRHAPFWEEIVKEKITLLSSIDIVSSISIDGAVSLQEKDSFLEDIVEVQTTFSAPMSIVVDDDDLFDNMA